MPEAPQLKKSFSAWMRWGHALDLVVRTLLVLAVAVMVNYLAGRWHERFHLSTPAHQSLSPRSLGLLKSFTNHINVTLYFDRADPLYSTVTALLDEYRDANGRIHVGTVDYIRDAAAALALKEKYKDNGLLNVGTNKDLVIFDCAGRVKAVNGRELAQYVTEQDPTGGPLNFRKRMMFYGESLFTAALINVLNPKPLQACYLVGHGEASLDDTSPGGYQTFHSILLQNNIQAQRCTLIGTNTIPADCNLLIVAGPLKPLAEAEREKIDDYLRQGGRMLALFNSASLTQPTGLEKVLNAWGVEVINAAIGDRKNTQGYGDAVAYDFSDHPVVNALHESALQLILPRPVGRMSEKTSLADAPRVEELAFTSPEARLPSGTGPRRYSLAVAVEKGNVPGVTTERGTTRIVAVGDSIFLTNHYIESAGNKDFAGYAVNWLLERTQLMQGLGPRVVAEYRLTLTAAKRHTVQWLLLAVLPGAVLAWGGLVWLRRRS